MKNTLNLIQLNKISSLCSLQSYRENPEHIISDVDFTNKPFGYEARENVVRGIPRS